MADPGFCDGMATSKARPGCSVALCKHAHSSKIDVTGQEVDDGRTKRQCRIENVSSIESASSNGIKLNCTVAVIESTPRRRQVHDTHQSVEQTMSEGQKVADNEVN